MVLLRNFEQSMRMGIDELNGVEPKEVGSRHERTFLVF